MRDWGTAPVLHSSMAGLIDAAGAWTDEASVIVAGEALDPERGGHAWFALGATPPAACRLYLAADERTCDQLVDAWLAGMNQLLVPDAGQPVASQVGRLLARPSFRWSHARAAPDPMVRRLIELLDLARWRLSVKEVAVGMGVTERTLRRHVEAALGVSPGDVIAQCRAAMRDYLMLAGLPLPVVARSLGHASVRAFYGSLRHATGNGTSVRRALLRTSFGLRRPMPAAMRPRCDA